MTSRLTAAQDLQTAEYAYGQMTLKLQEFTLHARYSRWEQAELARESAMALMEAHTDAFMRACRATSGE